MSKAWHGPLLVPGTVVENHCQLDLQMCYDKKKREKTFFIHVVKRICFLCLNNLESNWNDIWKLAKNTILAIEIQQPFDSRAHVNVKMIISRCNGMLHHSLGGAALYWSCLVFNALLAILTKEAGNKGIKSKKGASTAMKRKVSFPFVKCGI